MAVVPLLSPSIFHKNIGYPKLSQQSIKKETCACATVVHKSVLETNFFSEGSLSAENKRGFLKGSQFELKA